ncbi:MAG: FmdB family zinc ribbon protein [Pyrinomonadaceae bacterium]
MPIYEYKCSNCGAHFEKLQKATDEPLTHCEVCGGQLQKQWSLSGFQFKGEGWYVTDYAKKSAGGLSSNSGTTENKETAESTDTPKSASKEKTKDAPKKEKAPEK